MGRGLLRIIKKSLQKFSFQKFPFERDGDFGEGPARRVEKYGKAGKNRKIAVLGKGTEYQSLAFSPEVLKFFDLKRWNLYTILAKCGIPPRVANIQDRQAPLSGKDTAEQHAAFWKGEVPSAYST
jgi:hypothetical protein